MHIAAAHALLENAIAALFTDPQPRSHNVQHVEDIPLCGCARALPLAWRALREFPVCWRWVVATWSALADSLVPLTRNKTARSDPAIERRAVSMTRLCAILYQCGILASGNADDSEVVAATVQAMANGGFSVNVVASVVRSRLLVRQVRFRLFQYSIMQAYGDSEMWVGDVAVALQDELRQASVDPLTPAKKPKKRRRGGVGKGDLRTVSYECCATREDMRREIVGVREALVVSLMKWINSRGERDERTVIKAVQGLIEVLKAPEVVKLLENKVVLTKRDRRGDYNRNGRMSRALKHFRWEDCDQVVNEVCAHETMWRCMWKRQRKQCVVGAKKIESPGEIVSLCASVDQFAHSPILSIDANSTKTLIPTVGFRVFRAILRRTDSASFLLLLRAIRTAAQSEISLQIPNVRVDKRRIYVNYTRQLLLAGGECEASETCHHDTERGINRVEYQGDTVDDLLEGLHHVHDVLDHVHSDIKTQKRAVSDLLELWFRLIFNFTCSSASRLQGLAPPWSSFLDAIAQCCEELKTRSAHLVQLFQALVVDVIVCIVNSNGTHLGSPSGSCLMLIPMDEASQSTLIALLSVIVSACASVSSKLVSSVVYRLCVIAARQDPLQNFSALPVCSNQRDGGGIRRLLCPLLATHFSTASISTGAALSSVVMATWAKLQSDSNSPALARALVQLLFAWDAYSDSNSTTQFFTAAHGDPTRHRSGMAVAIELGVWQDFVHYYSVKPDRWSVEPPAFLNYSVELLRGVDPATCPAELEGSLFSVVSTLTSTLSRNQLKDCDPQLLSHSDEAIQRFIQTFQSLPDTRQCRELVTQLRCDHKLEDLLLSLRRWLGLIAASPRALPKETEASFVLLANRLIYWGGSDFGCLKTLLSAVDPALVAALQTYSSPQSQSDTLTHSTSVSVVRLSVMVRSYLASTSVPDLVGLTTTLITAAVECASLAACQGILKLLHGLGGSLVMPVVVETLRESLMLVDGDQTKLQRLRNSLALVTAGPHVFQTRAVLLSCNVFSVTTGEFWLTAFLHVGFASVSSSDSITKSVEALLDCLETLLSQDQGESSGRMAETTILQHCYPLLGTLSTALLAFSIVSTESAFLERVTSVYRALQAQVQLVDETTKPAILDPSTQRLVAFAKRPIQQRDRRRKARPTEELASCLVNIHENSASVSCSGWRFLETSWDSVCAGSPSTNIGDQPRLILSFSSWLASAFLLSRRGSSTHPKPFGDVWERVFDELVLQCYLPLEFNNDAFALTATWLATWITESLKSGDAIGFLPIQRSRLLQLLSSSNPWHQLVQCVQRLVSSTAEVSLRRRILYALVDSLECVTLCSLRPLDLETSNSMVDDITTLLGQITHSNTQKEPLVELIKMVAPLLEILMSASLTGQHPYSAAKRVGLLLQDALARSRPCQRWWNDLLPRWKRQHSYKNRVAAPLIFAALEFQLCDLTSDD